MPYLCCGFVETELVWTGLSKVVDKLRASNDDMPIEEFWDFERAASVLLSSPKKILSVLLSQGEMQNAHLVVPLLDHLAPFNYILHCTKISK